MKKNLEVTLLAILMISLVGVAESSTIRLKSGIFLKGDVLSITQGEVHIKTSFGKDMTYRVDDIMDIDGKPPLNKEVLFNSWKGEIGDYYVKTQKIIGIVILEFQTLRKQIAQTSNQKQVEQLIKNFRNQIFMHKTEMEALKFPSGLEGYHLKVIEHLTYLDLSKAYLLENKLALANENLKLANQTYYDAIMELKTNFQLRGAPQKILDQLDVVLMRFEHSLKIQKNARK